MGEFISGCRMSVLKKTCGLVVSMSLVFSGCTIPLGVRTNVVGTATERVPISTSSSIESEVRSSPGNQAIVKLTRMTEEDVRTVEMRQIVRRHYDITGLWICVGFGIAIGFIIMLILGINSGGGGGDGDD